MPGPSAFEPPHIILPTALHTHTVIALHGRGSQGPEVCLIFILQHDYVCSRGRCLIIDQYKHFEPMIDMLLRYFMVVYQPAPF